MEEKEAQLKTKASELAKAKKEFRRFRTRNPNHELAKRFKLLQREGNAMVKEERVEELIKLFQRGVNTMHSQTPPPFPGILQNPDGRWPSSVAFSEALTCEGTRLRESQVSVDEQARFTYTFAIRPRENRNSRVRGRAVIFGPL
jgi:hypothetical protein